MNQLAFRLKKGTDLKLFIDSLPIEEGLWCVISAVGCLDKIHLRLAGAKEQLYSEADYEILSLNGTICKTGSHLHISLSDCQGKCIGGHLLTGCIVNTTCELVIAKVEDYDAYRIFDPDTGYKELVIK